MVTRKYLKSIPQRRKHKLLRLVCGRVTRSNRKKWRKVKLKLALNKSFQSERRMEISPNTQSPREEAKGALLLRVIKIRTDIVGTNSSLTLVLGAGGRGNRVGVEGTLHQGMRTPSHISRGTCHLLPKLRAYLTGQPHPLCYVHKGTSFSPFLHPKKHVQ